MSIVLFLVVTLVSYIVNNFNVDFAGILHYNGTLCLIPPES